MRAPRSKSSRSSSDSHLSRRKIGRTSTHSAVLPSPSPAASRRAASACATRAGSSSKSSKPTSGGSRSSAFIFRRPRTPRNRGTRNPDGAARAPAAPLRPGRGRPVLSAVQTTMTGAATFFAKLRGAGRAVAAVVLGALSVLAFAPVHAWPVLFFTFGALVWLLDGCHAEHARLPERLKAAAVIGFCFGFGYFLAGLYWVAAAFLVEPWRHGWLLPFVMTAFPGGMALFFAASAALAMLLWVPGPARAFALAIGFFVAEFARGHVLTGFPWNLVGYSLLGSLPLMQLAALFGVYALSLLAVLLFAAPATIFAPSQSGLARGRGTFALAALLLVLLVAGYGWGERRLQAAGMGDTNIRVRIVQANIDQAEKWRPENSAEIFTDYLALTRSGPSGLDGIAIVVWPETAVPFFLADAPEALTAIANVLPAGTTLLVGSGRLVEDRDAGGLLIRNRRYNSGLVIDGNGRG